MPSKAVQLVQLLRSTKREKRLGTVILFVTSRCNAFCKTCFYHEELNQPAKTAILECLADRVQFGNEVGPLMVELHRYVASLVRCFTGDERELRYAARYLKSSQPASSAESRGAGQYQARNLMCVIDSIGASVLAQLIHAVFRQKN